jgi:hypothetical protein
LEVGTAFFGADFFDSLGTDFAAALPSEVGFTCGVGFFLAAGALFFDFSLFFGGVALGIPSFYLK